MTSGTGRLWASVWFVAMAGVLLLMLSALADAQELKYSGTKHAQIIEEVLHTYTVKTFATPVQVNESMKADALPEPERVVAKWILAMRMPSYDQALAFWDPQSRQRIVDSNKASGKDAKAWESSWLQRYTSQQFVIKERITYGRYILIPYWNAQNSNEPVETVALKRDGNRWFLTLDLVSSPVLTNWRNPQTRVQKIPDALYQSEAGSPPK